MIATQASTISKSDARALWQGAKSDIEFAPALVEQIIAFSQDMIETGLSDHPTRVYVDKPSERFLLVMTPLLGLKRTGSANGLPRWQVEVSARTDKLDPIAARNVNNFLADSLQELFWKKDAYFVVDSARIAS